MKVFWVLPFLAINIVLSGCEPVGGALSNVGYLVTLPFHIAHCLTNDSDHLSIQATYTAVLGDPEISSGGKVLGTAPLTIVYEFERSRVDSSVLLPVAPAGRDPDKVYNSQPAQIVGDEVILPELKATWSSGAVDRKEPKFSLEACENRYGYRSSETSKIQNTEFGISRESPDDIELATEESIRKVKRQTADMPNLQDPLLRSCSLGECPKVIPRGNGPR